MDRGTSECGRRSNVAALIAQEVGGDRSVEGVPLWVDCVYDYELRWK